ncbi:cytochrome c [Geomicrobium sp. JCM 19038]|uniref:c-type cytochrome n=1 Tax=Geomicrobium sp. JCM 19038 TaxID=1460635 RepID=UPI00045F1B9E|nr:cytochrome c [Geomicrobium sp. JCM 19038]GAK08764.1 cytochrome c551 [Geomicrobium sp. JCM 19038]
MKKFLIMMAGSAMLLAACGGGDDAGEEGEETAGGTYDAEAAASLYESNCLSCHGDNGSGASGPEIAGMDVESVLAAIEEGPGGMPADIVTGEEAENVAQYVSEQ